MKFERKRRRKGEVEQVKGLSVGSFPMQGRDQNGLAAALLPALHCKPLSSALHCIALHCHLLLLLDLVARADTALP